MEVRWAKLRPSEGSCNECNNYAKVVIVRIGNMEVRLCTNCLRNLIKMIEELGTGL